MSANKQVCKVITNTDYVSSWKSKGLSAETIKPSTAFDNSLTPKLDYYYDFKVRVKFTGSCLKQPKFTHTHKTIGKHLHCLRTWCIFLKR